MSRKLKCFTSILLSCIMVIGLTTVVSAVEPRYSDTHSVIVHLVFYGTTAYCEAEIRGANGTSSITDGNLILTDSNGNSVGKWTNLSSTTDKLSVSKSVTGLTKGETYTLSFSATVNRNGNAEPVSNSSTKTCPK